MTMKVLWGLIGISAAILAVAALSAQAYSEAALAVAIGVVWIGLEIKGRSPIFNSVCFAALVGLAVFAGVKTVSPPLLLLGLAADLAAWDLSRFRLRISSETDDRTRAALETKHVRRLAPVIVVGVLVALLPLLIHFTVSFVVLCLIVLVALFTLRRAMLALPGNKQQA